MRSKALSLVILLLASTIHVVLAQAVQPELTPQDGQEEMQQDFDGWDQDGDGYINDTEFESGVTEQGYYNLYDSNADGMIDDAEWRKAQENHDYLESDYYSRWDADEDGYLNQDEFNQGAYERWDSNRDGQIDDTEYDNNYADWVPH